LYKLVIRNVNAGVTAYKLLSYVLGLILALVLKAHCH